MGVSLVAYNSIGRLNAEDVASDWSQLTPRSVSWQAVIGIPNRQSTQVFVFP